MCVSFKASKAHVTLKIAKRGSNFDTNPRGSKMQNSRVHTFTYSAVATSFTSDAGVFAGQLAYFFWDKNGQHKSRQNTITNQVKI